VIAIDQADVFNLGAGFEWLWAAFYREVFDRDHRIAILKLVAVAVFDSETLLICGFFDRLPFMSAFRANRQAFQFISIRGLADGAEDKFSYGNLVCGDREGNN